MTNRKKLTNLPEIFGTLDRLEQFIELERGFTKFSGTAKFLDKVELLCRSEFAAANNRLRRDRDQLDFFEADKQRF
jgi:hypothetical protein